MNAVQRKRLLNVAKALRESPEPKAFTMGAFCDYFCGTPACALGHYASRRDLQRVLRVQQVAEYYNEETGKSEPWFEMCNNEGYITGYDDEAAVLGHFGITVEESDELFGSEGCGDAQTPKQAARYIERFVARKEREAARARAGLAQ